MSCDWRIMNLAFLRNRPFDILRFSDQAFNPAAEANQGANPVFGKHRQIPFSFG